MYGWWKTIDLLPEYALFCYHGYCDNLLNNNMISLTP